MRSRTDYQRGVGRGGVGVVSRGAGTEVVGRGRVGRHGGLTDGPRQSRDIARPWCRPEPVKDSGRRRTCRRAAHDRPRHGGSGGSRGRRYAAWVRGDHDRAGSDVAAGVGTSGRSSGCNLIVRGGQLRRPPRIAGQVGLGAVGALPTQLGVGGKRCVGSAAAAGAEALLACIDDINKLDISAGQVAAALHVVARSSLNHEHKATEVCVLLLEALVVVLGGRLRSIRGGDGARHCRGHVLLLCLLEVAGEQATSPVRGSANVLAVSVGGHRVAATQQDAEQQEHKRQHADDDRRVDEPETGAEQPRQEQHERDQDERATDNDQDVVLRRVRGSGPPMLSTGHAARPGRWRHVPRVFRPPGGVAPDTCRVAGSPGHARCRHWPRRRAPDPAASAFGSSGGLGRRRNDSGRVDRGPPTGLLTSVTQAEWRRRPAMLQTSTNKLS